MRSTHLPHRFALLGTLDAGRVAAIELEKAKKGPVARATTCGLRYGGCAKSSQDKVGPRISVAMLLLAPPETHLVEEVCCCFNTIA